jgi:GTP-binding protein
VLIDSRLPAQQVDLDFMEWLGIKGIPFSIVFTKIDKLTSSQLNKNLLAYKKEMLKYWEEMPISFTSSASSKFGKDALLNYMDGIIAGYENK